MWLVSSGADFNLCWVGAGSFGGSDSLSAVVWRRKLYGRSFIAWEVESTDGEVAVEGRDGERRHGSSIGGAVGFGFAG